MKATLATTCLLVASAFLCAEGHTQPERSPQPSGDKQVRDGQAGGGTAPSGVVARYTSNVFSLVRAESVQEELVLTDDQKLKLAPLLEEYDMALIEFSKQPIPEQGNRPSREETLKALAERRRKTDELIEEKAPGVLAVLTAEQSVRISQIMLQKERGNALHEVDVRAKLSITGEQQHKLIEISNAFGARFVATMRQSRAARTPLNMTTRETIAKEGRDAAMMAVLTPAQREQFQSLIGKEFNVKSLDPTINPSSR